MTKTFKKWLMVYAIIFPIFAMQYLGYSDILKSYSIIQVILILCGKLAVGAFITLGVFLATRKHLNNKQ